MRYYFEFVMWIAVTVAIIGIAAPMLVSSASHGGVLLGFCVLVAFFAIVLKRVIKITDAMRALFNEEKKDEQN